MVSKNIKYLRSEVEHLTQTKFADLFGVTRGMIDSYERAISKPSADFLKLIASRYKITVDVIMTKDLSLNPGLVIEGEPVQQSTDNEMLLKKLVKTMEEKNTLERQVNDLTARYQELKMQFSAVVGGRDRLNSRRIITGATGS